MGGRDPSAAASAAGLPAPRDRRGYSPGEASKLLRYARDAQTVRNWCKAGIVTAVHDNSDDSRGRYYLPVDELVRIIDRPPIGPLPARASIPLRIVGSDPSTSAPGAEPHADPENQAEVGRLTEEVARLQGELKAARSDADRERRTASSLQEVADSYARMFRDYHG